MGALAVVAFIAVWAAFVAAVIRADARDEAAYQRWYDAPARPWNTPVRGGDDRG